MKQARDGDHYRLTLDRPGTWSQKYNLIWDRLLNLHLFPPQVAQRETRFYLGRLTRFGLPLDSRQTYTKLDWSVWSACLTNHRPVFEAMIGALYEWAHTTPSRVPLTDWHETRDGRQVGFQARSVVGGIFIKLLLDRPRAASWSARP